MYITFSQDLDSRLSDATLQDWGRRLAKLQSFDEARKLADRQKAARLRLKWVALAWSLVCTAVLYYQGFGEGTSPAVGVFALLGLCEGAWMFGKFCLRHETEYLVHPLEESRALSKALVALTKVSSAAASYVSLVNASGRPLYKFDIARANELCNEELEAAGVVRHDEVCAQLRAL